MPVVEVAVCMIVLDKQLTQVVQVVLVAADRGE
jgi:hypothetical protein